MRALVLPDAQEALRRGPGGDLKTQVTPAEETAGVGTCRRDRL
jgi:hypothetical protein